MIWKERCTQCFVSCPHPALRCPTIQGCKRAHAAHVASVLGAAFFFTAEEVWPDAPLFHATWHLFGAAAIATGNQVIMGGGGR